MNFSRKFTVREDKMLHINLLTMHGCASIMDCCALRCSLLFTCTKVVHILHTTDVV